MTERMIDTPSPFAPIETWREYLKELEAIESPSLEVKVLIREARKVIAQADAG